jgi:AraC-like DNA-binding protein
MEKGILYHISFFGSFLALLFTLGYQLSPIKSKKKQSLSLGLFLIFCFLFHNVYMSSNFFLSFPYLYLYHLPILFLFGPILSRIIFIFLEGEIPQWLNQKWNFLPAVLVFLFQIPIYFQSPDQKIESVAQIRKTLNTEFLDQTRIVLILGSISLVIYIGHTFFHIVRIFRWNKIWENIAVRMLVLLLTIALLATLGGVLISFGKMQLGLSLGIFFLSTIVPLVYIIQTMYPSLFEDVKLAIQEEKKYQNSQLKNIDTQSWDKILAQLFIVDKIFLDEDLSLSILAEKMQSTTHQVSEYLNSHKGKSFHQYIHSFRIQYACQLLKEHPDWATIRVAYESGFQSKSSFHGAFKKEIGMAPTEYRKKISSN